MSGEQRRAEILAKLKNSSSPLSGGRLAREFHISRQVIVQDIALLRAEGHKITSASRGYLLLENTGAVSRVFKVYHTAERTEEELNLFVDYGGFVRDVFIYHRAYGVVRVPLELRSRLEVRKFMEDMKGGISKGISDATSGYHYHTIEADSEEILDLIQEELKKRGFLAKLQDYEPVDFWKNGETE